jgi:transcriptional regulator with XRE-family HTH domain
MTLRYGGIMIFINNVEEVDEMNPLRRERVLQEKSIHLVALKADIDSGKLSLIERGLKEPTPEEKRRLAKVLRARIRDLFPTQEVSHAQGH